jgi:peptide deformylase
MKILISPHQFLRKKAKPVATWTPKLSRELAKMTSLLKNARDPEGVGLAATQVGLNKRFFIVLNKGKLNLFINPEIVSSSTKMLSDRYKNEQKRPLEGCLSIPKFWGFVNRPYQITLKYQTLTPDNDLKSLEKNFKGLEAISIQHERDHLDGILFTDHILAQQGILYKQEKSGLHPVEIK